MNASPQSASQRASAASCKPFALSLRCDSTKADKQSSSQYIDVVLVDEQKVLVLAKRAKTTGTMSDLAQILKIAFAPHLTPFTSRMQVRQSLRPS